MQWTKKERDKERKKERVKVSEGINKMNQLMASWTNPGLGVFSKVHYIIKNLNFSNFGKSNRGGGPTMSKYLQNGKKD